MKFKNFLYFTLAVFILTASSVILHEFVHFIQYHYIFEVPYNCIELHFFWELRNQSVHTPLTFPIAWVSVPEFKTTAIVTQFELNSIEPVAYTVQFIYITLIYRAFIHNNKKLMWR